MPKKNVRVVIPTNPTEQIALLGKIKTKSDELGDASPLKGLKWNKIGPALATAKLNDDTANDLSKQVENAYGARDPEMPMVAQALRDARDILLGLNSDNPKALGDWKFEVNDSPQASSTPAPPQAATANK
jgi:hypothetical protein